MKLTLHLIQFVIGTTRDKDASAFVRTRVCVHCIVMTFWCCLIFDDDLLFGFVLFWCCTYRGVCTGRAPSEKIHLLHSGSCFNYRTIVRSNIRPHFQTRTLFFFFFVRRTGPGKFSFFPESGFLEENFTKYHFLLIEVAKHAYLSNLNRL